MKKIWLLFLLFSSEAAAYQYSYIPKSSVPVIYNFLYKKREKCTTGEIYAYPQKVGVCASCKEDGAQYLIDDTKNKPGCFLCPEGTLLVKRNGYPMCLSNYPVTDGKAQKPNGNRVSKIEVQRMAAQLSADYKTVTEKITAEDTFKNKEKLLNVCNATYTDDPTAKRQVMTCQKLGQKNDFLCPYVEKNADNSWICRACPKNAPYKKPDGGCFNCPYGEEMVMQENGEAVCASEVPASERKTVIQEKKKSVPRKKAVSKTKKTVNQKRK